MRRHSNSTHYVKVTSAVAGDKQFAPLVGRYAALALERSAGRIRKAPPAALPVPKALDFPCVVLRINQAWREGMDVDDVYDVTHGWWVMGPQREQAEYAVAVAHGVVRGIFRVHGWRPRHRNDDGSPATSTRWGFDGEPADEYAHLVGLNVRHLFRRGDANPVRYVNVGPSPAQAEARSWEESRPASDRRAEDLSSLCTRLRKNPVLHLSLTSKELFHSNFLGWLFERSSDVALACLGPLAEADPQQLVTSVRREDHHLDLVVEIAGQRPIVVENKVLSLPDEAQLDGYTAKNIPAAGVPGAVKVLLSLTDPGWVDGQYAGWRLLSYDDVAARLVPAVERHLAEDMFVQQLVLHWAEMIGILSRIAALTAPERDDPLLLDADAVELLRQLRLHDAYQKFRTRRVRHLLQQHLQRHHVAVDDLESGMTNGSPLLSGRLFMPDGAEIGWQLQGSQWRRFVITPEQYKGKSEAKKLERIAYADEHHRAWFTFAAEQELGPFAKAPTDDYKHYAPDFLYDYVRVPGITVQLVLALADTVLREGAEYRANWKSTGDT